MARSSLAAAGAAAVSRRQTSAHLIIVVGGSVLSASNSMISVTITPTTVLEIGGVGAIARLARRFWDLALVAGPALVAAGLAGLALALPDGSLPWIVAAATIVGTGYGTCWAFLGQRIMAGAKPGEGDQAAASIATLEMAGIALGAALAGIMGNALGVDDRATAANLRAAAGIGHALFLPILLFAVVAATHLVRLGSAGR